MRPPTEDELLLAPNEVRRWLIAGLQSRGLEAELAEKVVDCFVWPRPIPVSERLPGDDGWYLVFNPHDADPWHLAQYAGGGRWDADEWYCGEDKYVTHWLPLPPKPE